MTPRRPDPHPLVVERFGPLRALQEERWLPVPADRKGLCAQGPSIYAAFLDHAEGMRRLREDAA